MFASDIGYLFGYAHLTNTRSLALVGDPESNAYELLFSFSSSEEKDQFQELVRSNLDMGNDYIENDLLSPTTEEIRDARPLAMVLPCVAGTQGESLHIVTFDLITGGPQDVSRA
jgi:hypothetical protein